MNMRVRLFNIVFTVVAVAGIALVLYMAYLFLSCHGCPYVQRSFEPW